MSDHERPLAERGRKDAPVAGRRLADTGIALDLALCSTADRTRETWKLAVHELPHRPKTVYEERLYEASLGELIALLNETPDDVHEPARWSATTPACTRLADALAGQRRGRHPGADDPQRLPDRRLRRASPSPAPGSPWSTAWARCVDYWAPHE